MKSTAPFRLTSDRGVELWRLETNGAEQFAVRTGSGPARLMSTLAAAEALVAHHVQQAKLVRAH